MLINKLILITCSITAVMSAVTCYTANSAEKEAIRAGDNSGRGLDAYYAERRFNDLERKIVGLEDQVHSLARKIDDQKFSCEKEVDYSGVKWVCKSK